MATVYQGLWTGLALGAIFALVAAGFSLFYRSSGLVNMAHGATVMVVGYLLSAVFGGVAGSTLAPIAGLLIGAGVGLVFYVLLVLPAAHQGGRQVLAMTLGGSFALAGVVQAVWGTTGRGLGSFATWTLSLPGGTLTGQDAVAIIIAVVVGVLMAVLLRRTMIGRALRAVAEDPVGAACVGINARALQALAMIISGGLAGLAAACIVPQQGVDATTGDTYLLVAIVAAVLGGLRSFWGSAAGALLLGLVIGVVSGVAVRWVDVVEFGVLIAVLAVRPAGLTGRSRATA